MRNVTFAFIFRVADINHFTSGLLRILFSRWIFVENSHPEIRILEEETSSSSEVVDMPEPLPANMEQVHVNISVEDSEREKREQEIRNNQDIAQKKVIQAKNIKPRNEMKVGKSERLEAAKELLPKLRVHIGEEKRVKTGQPMGPPELTELTSGVEKLTLGSKCEPPGPPKLVAVKPSTQDLRSRCAEPRRKTEPKLCDLVVILHGPDKGSPRPCARREGDDVNPAKYSRPAPSGAVENLNTPLVGEVERPDFPGADDLDKAVASMGAATGPYQYVQQASPGSDSGYSGCELSPVSLELPPDVEILLDQFFYGCDNMSGQDVFLQIAKMNLSLDTKDRIEAKIVAWIKEHENMGLAEDMTTSAPPLLWEETRGPTLNRVVHGKRLPGLDDADDDLVKGMALGGQGAEPQGPYTPIRDPSELYPTAEGAASMSSVPSMELPVSVTAERRTTARDPQRAADNQGAKRALQQCILTKGGMRTEPLSGWGLGGFVRRHMTDINKFVQCLPDSERAELKECQEIIKKQSPTEITKINENGDTLLHLYMIYSPELESSMYPPRRKMKLLLYSLLERLTAMGRVDEFINRRNDKGQTPLYLAACVVNFPLAVQMFLHFGADPNIRRPIRDNDGPAPIHKVVERGDECLETLNYLLASDKCDPNLFYEGLTPLMIASRSHQSRYLNPDTKVIAPVSTRECVLSLLSCNRVDAFAKSAGSGRAALHYAVENKGHVDLVSAWRDFADREHPTEITPQKTRLKLINVADRDGSNVLHILAGLAPFDKQLELARLLLSMGAELTKRNGEKKMPRDLARSMKNKELTELFALPKTRKSSNPARQRFSQSRSGSDDTPTLAYAPFDFNQAVGYQFGQLSPGSSVFSSDSGQRISPPIPPTTTQPLIDFTQSYGDGVYMFNGQVTTYSTISSNPSLVTTQAPYVQVGGASPPQGALYGSSDGFSPRSGSSGSRSPGGQYQQVGQHGGHPQQYGGVSPQHGGGSGHSPQHAGQHSPQGGHSPQHYQQQLSPQYQQMLGGLSPQRVQTTAANLVPIQTTAANLVPIQTTAANLVPTSVNLSPHVTTCPPGYVPTTVHGQHHVTTWSRADHVTDSDDNPFAGVFTTHN